MTKKIKISKSFLFTSKELINYLKTVKKFSNLDEEILAAITYKYAFQKLTNKDVLIGFPYKENKQKELNARPLLKSEEIGLFIQMHAEENSDIDAMFVDPIDLTNTDFKSLLNSRSAYAQLLQIKFLGKGAYKDFTEDKFIRLLEECLRYAKNEIVLVIYAEGSFSLKLQQIIDWLDQNAFPFREVVFIIPNDKNGNMDFYPLKNSYCDLNPLRMTRDEILREF